MQTTFPTVRAAKFAGTIFVLSACAAAAPHFHHNESARRKPIPPAKARQVRIDLDKALAVSMPPMTADLQPAVFKTPDGKQGWVLRIPGDRPIATPAYADGKLFVGGGYGSHEFYAFDAQTGKVAWAMTTSDDGPTAAVVEDGYVAFNTESCTVCVVNARTGKLVWQEWLGDPLMSQPAIWNGRLYMAYPAGQRGHAGGAPNPTPPAVMPNLNTPVEKTAVPNQAPQSAAGPSVEQNAAQGSGAGYRMLCTDLKTGRHLWQRGITADVISAPVIEGGQLFLTCFDGTSYALNAVSGAVVWKKHDSGTSAPVIADGQMVLTSKTRQNGRDYEGFKRVDPRAGNDRDAKLLAMGRADYFEKGGSVALNAPSQAALDSSVGFGGGASGSAAMPETKANLGISTVAGGWAYQGSRAAYRNGQFLNAQGSNLNALRGKDGSLAWHAEAAGKNVGPDAQVFSPPALGNRNMYLCTTSGDLLSVDQKDGKVGFLYATRLPMAFQPALAQGNIYVGTANGLLVCLKTGDKDADGWTAWGGNAQHNKKN